MKKKILISIFLILSVSLIYGCSTPGNVVAPTKNCKDVQVPYEVQEEYIKTEYYTETVPYTDEECENEYLTYKLERGSCVQRVDRLLGEDKSAKYDCTITNLDNERGLFTIRIGFNIEGQQLEETQEGYIYPQSSKTFYIERDALIDGCYCSEQSIPTKRICKEVTKYKEVQREKQTTAYRPVTKYKTEQKCD